MREISLCEWICKRPPFYYVPAERRGGDFCNQLCLMNSYKEKSKSSPFYHELISFPKSPPSPDLVLRENRDQPNDRHTANLESWCFELQASVSNTLTLTWCSEITPKLRTELTRRHCFILKSLLGIKCLFNVLEIQTLPKYSK